MCSGFLQYTVGERLDLLLLPSDARSLGEITLMSGVEQSWEQDLVCLEHLDVMIVLEFSEFFSFD